VSGSRFSRILLQLEGTAVFAVAFGIYSVYGASWWWMAGLFLVPDGAMLAYLRGPRIGAVAYNLMHTYVTPLVVGGLAFAFKSMAADVASLAGSIALIWVAHIGFDRMLGYGLKEPTGFGHTHLRSWASDAPVASDGSLS
jgi:hypothetical protein